MGDQTGDERGEKEVPVSRKGRPPSVDLLSGQCTADVHPTILSGQPL